PSLRATAASAPRWAWAPSSHRSSTSLSKGSRMGSSEKVSNRLPMTPPVPESGFVSHFLGFEPSIVMQGVLGTSSKGGTSMAKENVRELNELDFAGEVLECTGTVLVDFTADWCPPCKALTPVVERMADALRGRVTVASVNADACPELASRFKIRGL